MPERGRSFRAIAGKKGQLPGRALHIIFTEGDFAAMRAAFDAHEARGLEGYAVELCGIKADRRSAMYMVRSLHIQGEGDLIDHTSVSVTPSADFLEAVLAGAAERQCMVLEVHTHPGSASPSFSAVDVDHGVENGRFLRSCRTGFGMMVIGCEGFAVMEYNGESDRLRSPAAAALSIMTLAGAVELKAPAADAHAPEKRAGDAGSPPAVDRQVRLWGEGCQRRIAGTTAGVVGLGGTGSMLLQALARMGVRKFVLCDPDAIEASNLSRLPYAFAGDVGKRKARVAAGHVRKIAGDAAVETVVGRVEDAGAAFRGCDVLFGCADNDGARLALNALALKYFIPYVDTGTEIFLEGGRVRDMGGQVRVVVPGVTGCLECVGAIDHEAAAISRLPAEDAAVQGAAGYVRGTGLTPAPAVITLNAVVAALAAQEFVDMAARREREAPENYYLYDATGPVVRRLAFDRAPECPMCGPGGILGAGDPPRSARHRVKPIAAP